MSTFYTYHQVAELLHVPPKTVAYWVSTGRLAAVKPGRHPLIKASELEAFIEASSVNEQRASAAKTRARARRARAVAP